MKAKNNKESVVLLLVTLFFSFMLLIIAIRMPIKEFYDVASGCVFVLIAAFLFIGGMSILIRNEIRSIEDEFLIKTPPKE